MMNIALLAALAATLAQTDLQPLPTDASAWLADPIQWKFRPDGIRPDPRAGHGIAVCEQAPLSDEVTVEAVFTPGETVGREWKTAAVAIVQDERNFWHVALVEGPSDQGSIHTLELAEMREGQWLAQRNLQVAREAPGGGRWTFNTPCRLRLSLDKRGIAGSISTLDGKTLLDKRYAFTAPAVTRGRPALRTTGLYGPFTQVRAGWGKALPEARPDFPAYACDGFVPDVRDKATGFFRVVQREDGRWWTIDPLGRGMVLLGVDHVTFQGHWCEKLGYCPHGRKNKAKFKDHAEWEAQTLERLKAWGFNMLGAGCDSRLNHRGLVHTVFLSIGTHLASLGDEFDITPNEHKPCSAFPNVFHPDFEAFCRYSAARMCRPHRDDPWLLGYFIDNELSWWGRGASESGLFDAVMKKGPAHTAKKALRDFLAERAGNDVARFNAFWQAGIKGFDDVLSLPALPSSSAEQRAAKQAFLRLAAERYFAASSKAIRLADPNHMVLGARFAGTGGADPVVWEVSGKYCDIVTFNCYPMVDLDEGRVYTSLGRKGELVSDHFAKYYAYVKRPMLITEWSFPALDAGLPCLHGAGQRFRTQKERTEATALFARTMLSLPFLLGYDYFMWVDEPALGITAVFPEDSNYGLINEEGQPYELLTRMFASLHREAGRHRLAPPPPPRPRPPQGPAPDAMAAARRAARAAPPQAPRTHFTQEGGTFRAGNQRIELTGRLGPGHMVQTVALAGSDRPLGQYNAMIHFADPAGRNVWADAQAVKAVEGKLVEELAVVEITSAASFGEGGKGGFEVTHRLVVPPGEPWFFCELVRVKNTGPLPLPMRGAYFRAYGPFTAAPKMPPNVWGMPPSSCWMDEKDGRFYGAVAPGRSPIRISFWIDNTYKSLHPDAVLELDKTLAPGETFVPAEPVMLVMAGGLGGAEDWMRQTAKIQALLAP